MISPYSGVALNGLIKTGVSKYTIIDDYNIKMDTHAPVQGTQCGTGNWAYVLIALA